jgi:uncharacterized protein (DUF305 family)
VKRFSCGWGSAAFLFLTVGAAGGGLRVAEAQVTPPAIRYPATKDDAEFMQGMIGHHAQAIVMAGWAPTHGASQQVQVLCARIALSQSTEIKLMQDWLKVRGFPVPDSTGKMPMDHANMAGMNHAAHADSLMPGMLDDYQMKLLDEARGASFDRLFLTFMIQHHEGAITMVDKLFKSAAGGQDDDIFKFATAVHADQTAEIARMKLMLEGGGGG